MKPLPEVKLKSWFGRQVYLSLGILLGACAQMGLDSTPMEGIEFERYDEILGLTTYKTMVAVAVGIRDENDANQPKFKPKSRRALEDVVTVI